jgi:cholesterol oxidase
LAPDKSSGVTNSDRAHFGQVFGYEGLYVIDGAIVPTVVGSNPTATIAALSEMAAGCGVAPWLLSYATTAMLTFVLFCFRTQARC